MKKKMSEQSYYMNIPAEVWDSELTAKAMILYGHVSVLSNKKKYCYATNGYFEKVMKCSTSTITRCLKELEGIGIITRENIYHEGTKHIEMRKIYLNIGIIKNEYRPVIKNEHTPVITDEPDNTTSNNNKISNNKNNIKITRVYDYFIENYPKNRINAKGPVIKYLKALSDEDLKLTIKNLNRYLTIANGYVKNIRNYLEQECWTEAWLSAEEDSRNNKQNTNKTDTKTFSGTYDDID